MRPVALLAAWLCAFDKAQPAGKSTTTDRLAALMVVRADWRSGQRSRPGRSESAALLGVSERTVIRHWRLLERLGLITRTAAGRHLARDEITALERRCNRAEWTCLMPPQVSATDAQPYLQDADKLLQTLDHPVDNEVRDDQVKHCRVTPSPERGCSSLRSYRRWYSRPCSRDEAATRPAFTKKKPTRKRPRHDGAARKIATRLQQRMFWLTSVPLPVLAAVLRQHVSAGWTVKDIQTAADETLTRRNWTVPNRPKRPAAYLRALLADHDLGAPPAQTRAAAKLAEQQQRAVARARTRQHSQEQLHHSITAFNGTGMNAAREAVRQATLRSRRRQLEDRSLWARTPLTQCEVAGFSYDS